MDLRHNPYSQNHRYRMSVSANRTSYPMQNVLAACATGMVSTQRALDADTRQMLIRWEEEGIPPSGWWLPACRMRLPVSLACRGRLKAGERSELVIHKWQKDITGRINLNIRFIPKLLA